MGWPAAIYRAAALEIRDNLSFEKDGARVLAEAVAALATLVKGVAGSKDRSMIPAEAVSETLCRTPEGQRRIKVDQDSKMKPIEGAPWLPD